MDVSEGEVDTSLILVAEPQNNVDHSNKFTIVGGNLGEYQSVISSDGRILFTCVSMQIKMFSVVTGEHLGVLKGHTAPVTKLVLNPKNRLQIYSGCLDGLIKLWDFSEGSCLQTFHIDLPILDFNIRWEKFVCHVVKNAMKPRMCAVVTLSIHTKRPTNEEGIGRGEEDEKVVEVYESRSGTGFATHGDFIATVSRRTLTIWNYKTHQRLKYTHDKTLTTVAFHPSDPYLATGDADGQIIFWDRYQHFDSMVTWRNHWHAHPVQCLAFTEDGAYLLSGGEEAVLVIWQLGTGHKQFLPRLGSTIRHISVSHDGNMYALACADSSVRIVSAITATITVHIRGLQHAHLHPIPPASRALRTGLINEPKHGGLVALSGMPGYVQFYDVFDDRHVMEVDVSGKNIISRTDEIVMPVIQLEHIAISKTGNWLATLEVHTNCEISSVGMSLKFFHYDQASSSFVMNTRIDNPHDSHVSTLVFHPSSTILVTASADKTFKVWQEQTVTTTTSTTSSTTTPITSWVCKAIGRYRDMEVFFASFSSDGSLLAVAHAQLITLWDVNTLTLKHTLLYPSPYEPLRLLQFLNQSSPFLVSFSAQTLFVWNLLTASVWWSCVLPVMALATDPFSSHFAVIVTPFGPESSQLLLFHPRHPTPLYVWPVPDVQIDELSDSRDSTQPKRLGAALTFVYPRKTKSAASACLAYVTNCKEIARVEGVYASLHSIASAKPPSALVKAKSESVFEKIYGKKYITDPFATTTAPAAHAPPSESRGALDLFAGPTHLLPPMSKLFSPFMSALLRPAAVEVSSPPSSALIPSSAATAPREESFVEKLASEDEIFEREVSSGIFEWSAKNSIFEYVFAPASCPFSLNEKTGVVTIINGVEPHISSKTGDVRMIGVEPDSTKTTNGTATPSQESHANKLDKTPAKKAAKPKKTPR